MDKTEVPVDLGVDGRWFWEKAMAEREIVDAHDLERLKIAARILDEVRADELEIEKCGRYTRGRFGRLYPHPAIKVVQENRAIFVRVITSMGLDIIDDREQGRLF